ncbi:MAG TPA: glycerophosphodiester phosphodiesterase [Gaiellaceae bacterium]|nr:glycerophosphodiester phosphodiesterase [Gaiellaceae bacterium]
MIRIGHKGAAALAPENTLASLQAAVDAGVDVVEFDVLRAGDGLVLGHSPEELPAETATLDDALALLAAAGCGAHVDVKVAGEEEGIVAALRRHGLVERAFVSTTRSAVLRRFAALEPGLGRALTYPEDRLGLTGKPWAAPIVSAALAAARATLPGRIGRLLARAQASRASLNEPLVTRAVVERCHALGAVVIAWTVNEPARLAELAAIGVDAVVTDDPRIFAATLSG